MKEINLPIPGDFSVTFVNEMLRIAKENNLGLASHVVWESEWNWYLQCEHGRVCCKTNL